MAVTKKNPADLTRRNNDARKNDIAKLRQAVKPIKPTGTMLVRLAMRQMKYEARTDLRLRQIEAVLHDMLGDN